MSIARALLKDAPILILDEPTSALDAETEGRLVAALERLMAGRTTFIIAHRLSTVRRADLILLMEDGRVIERGDHEQLMQARGAYYEMVLRQMETHGKDGEQPLGDDQRRGLTAFG